MNNFQFCNLKSIHGMSFYVSNINKKKNFCTYYYYYLYMLAQIGKICAIDPIHIINNIILIINAFLTPLCNN